MIVGVFLRNIKTYSGINYVPLSSGEKFCGLVGNNGIGKSSVLEALDVIFNNRQWNYNTTVRKGGLNNKTKPHIVPIYLVPKKNISDRNQAMAVKLSNYVWQVTETDIIISQNRVHFRTVKMQRNTLVRDFDKDEFLLLPLGISYDGIPNLSIFNTKKLGELFIEDFDATLNLISDENLEIFRPLSDELKLLVDYIYIPKDIDPENFAQLQAREIQSLMGESLAEVLERTVKKEQIEQINRDLKGFINDLSAVLTTYSFRTVTDRQQNIRKNDVYAMIIEAFFKIRKLHKSSGEHWLEISLLSSGEKQKAIIDIANYLLHKYRKRTDNIILAIDEPEASLHMSACYDQFNALFKMSELCMQLLFTTHWYGFIPTTEKGYVSVISKPGDYHQTDLINIAGYREEIKQTLRASNGKLPFDIRLKSLNDFIQSVITSILSDEPFNWLICEGSSEKIYFEKYFETIKDSAKLRIIPVGGASEIKRIYNNLCVAYDDFKKDIKGKVILISDTDSQIVQYETKSEFKNLICLRIVNNDKKHDTELVKIDSTTVSPKTEIEDSLNGLVFHKSLLKFVPEYPNLSTITDMTGIEESAVYYSLDISVKKQEILDSFFNVDNNKFKFAKEYVSNLDSNHKIPKWINDIQKLFVTD